MFDNRFFSDRSWILVNLNLVVEISTSFKNPRKINWMKFIQVAKSKLSGLRIGNIDTTDKLESKVGVLEIQNTTKNAATMEGLFKVKKLTREVFNICYRDKYWGLYKHCLKRYKSVMKKTSKCS